jgi:hypothetical protein
VTRILTAIAAGEREASRELLPLVHEDLPPLAASRLLGPGRGQTLHATALVHEAHVRLAGPGNPGRQGRAPIFGAAARAMPDVLVDHLEKRSGLKRGGHRRRAEIPSVSSRTVEGDRQVARAWSNRWISNRRAQ